MRSAVPALFCFPFPSLSDCRTRVFWAVRHRPAPLAPSLKIKRNAHSNSDFSVGLRPSPEAASRGSVIGAGPNCVPKKDGANFPEVLEFDHTMVVRCRFLENHQLSTRSSWKWKVGADFCCTSFGAPFKSMPAEAPNGGALLDK
jgi:hypothetical protein